MGRPGAERYVAGFSPTDSATDSPTDSAKRIVVSPMSLTKFDHWSILVMDMRAMGAMLVKMAVSFQ